MGNNLQDPFYDMREVHPRGGYLIDGYDLEPELREWNDFMINRFIDHVKHTELSEAAMYFSPSEACVSGPTCIRFIFDPGADEPEEAFIVETFVKSENGNNPTLFKTCRSGIFAIIRTFLALTHHSSSVKIIIGSQ